MNVPKIYVFLDYVGMSPDQVEGFIVNQLELYFQYVDGVQDINSGNIQQVALCELSFFPGTDMGQAMAQVVPIPTAPCVDAQRHFAAHDYAYGCRQRARWLLGL